MNKRSLLLMPSRLRMEWQFKLATGCERHQLRLLSKCPRGGTRFKIPALWMDVAIGVGCLSGG